MAHRIMQPSLVYTLRKNRSVTVRVTVLSASLSPVRKAPQSTDTAEGLLASCARNSSGEHNEAYACVATILNACDMQENSAQATVAPNTHL